MNSYTPISQCPELLSNGDPSNASYDCQYTCAYSQSDLEIDNPVHPSVDATNLSTKANTSVILGHGILFASHDQNIFLLDIPLSIYSAQFPSASNIEVPTTMACLSTPPLIKPFTIPEPKRSSNVSTKPYPLDTSTPVHLANSKIIKQIETALLTVRKFAADQAWCLPRFVKQSHSNNQTSIVTYTHTGLIENSLFYAKSLVDPSNSPPSSEFFNSFCATNSIPVCRSLDFPHANVKFPKYIDCPGHYETSDPVNQQPWQHILQNPQSYAQCVRLNAKFSPDPSASLLCRNVSHVFRLPPRSTSLLTSCRQTNSAKDLRRLLTEHNNQFTASCVPLMSLNPCPIDSNCKFNLVLLDPPWPNRSAKRARPYASHYPNSCLDRPATTREALFDLVNDLIDLKLNVVLDDHAWVAVWITNASSVRTAVLGSQDELNNNPDSDWLHRVSLFDQWNVKLKEEWIWVKITANGQCITSLNASWRKPYETLLVGRVERSTIQHTPCPVLRRFIFAVPDYHSRKPCLKKLFEKVLLNPTLANRDNQSVEASPSLFRKSGTPLYRALELFARYAVADWCSWGNEVCRYNWVGEWVKLENLKYPTGINSS